MLKKDDDKYIPLIAGKEFLSYSPEEFRAFVSSLRQERKRRKAAGAGKKKAKDFTFRVNKKGTLVLRVNREPKWLSRAEVEEIVRKTGLPANEVWIRVLRKEAGIILSSAEEQAEIRRFLDEMPF